jgi:flagellar hook protein FlgE
MSLYGVMRTGGSGMNAQSNKLSTVADNIANVNTTGYKRASTEFSSLVLRSGTGDYNSGSVETHVRYAITDPGTLNFTTSSTDLAIQGAGMFVVADAQGNNFLTRAGSFVPDGQGNLVNAAGFYLMGGKYQNGVAPSLVANGLSGLSVVNIGQTALQGNPSTLATTSANLDANAVALVGAPSTTNYTSKTSVVTYDNIGNQVTVDVYMSKLPLPATNSWDVAAYNGTTLLQNKTFTFDVSATGKGKLDTTIPSPTALNFTIPGGSAFTMDFSAMTQVADGFQFKPTVDGNAPGSIDKVEVAADGNMYAIYTDGTRLATYRIPLATVPSQDNLVPEAGNVYSLGINSGNYQTGYPGSSGLGTIKSEALEQSNVDLASELTSMIESQRGYTANSKVFQTGADLLDVLVNLKR